MVTPNNGANQPNWSPEAIARQQWINQVGSQQFKLTRKDLETIMKMSAIAADVDRVAHDGDNHALQWYLRELADARTYYQRYHTLLGWERHKHAPLGDTMDQKVPNGLRTLWRTTEPGTGGSDDPPESPVHGEDGAAGGATSPAELLGRHEGGSGERSPADP